MSRRHDRPCRMGWVTWIEMKDVWVDGSGGWKAGKTRQHSRRARCPGGVASS